LWSVVRQKLLAVAISGVGPLRCSRACPCGWSSACGISWAPIEPVGQRCHRADTSTVATYRWRPGRRCPV